MPLLASLLTLDAETGDRGYILVRREGEFIHPLLTLPPELTGEGDGKRDATPLREGGREGFINGAGFA